MKTKIALPLRAQKAKGKTLQELSEDNKSALHRVDKKQVNLKAASDTTGETLGGTFEPSTEQLAKINEFTRKTVGAEDVVAFTTMSCNDMYDRDDERFTTQCIKDFAELEQPYSFVGKSYMADHDYQMSKVRGRIFDVDTATEGGISFLKNDVYTPNTAQYAPFIENLDFGLAWAVSVGVVIDKTACSISGCGAPVYMSRFFGAWCQNGHDKGYWYDPNDEEKDAYGYFIPVEPDTPGAEKAMVDMSDPIDGYEISQVFLGAQYYAELAKAPGFKGLVKAASARPLPVIGLQQSEAAEIHFPEEPERVREAREKKFAVEQTIDGTYTWKDSQNLVWECDPEQEEVLCLGEASEITNKEEEDDGQSVSGRSGDDGSGSEDDGHDDSIDLSEAGQPPVSAGGSQEDGGQELGSGSGASGSSVDDPTTANQPKEGELTKQAVITAAAKAKLPTSILEALADAEGNGLEVALQLAAEEISKGAALQAKAAVGDQYVADLKAETLKWYVRAFQTGEKKGVNTDNVQKLLDACGDDIELIKSLRDDYAATARAKFPDTARRSVEVTDPNERHDVPEPQAKQTDGKSVSRIHG